MEGGARLHKFVREENDRNLSPPFTFKKLFAFVSPSLTPVTSVIKNNDFPIFQKIKIKVSLFKGFEFTVFETLKLQQCGLMILLAHY